MNERESRTAGVLEAAAHLLEATTALIKAVGYEIGPEQYQLPFEDYETVRQPQAPKKGTADEPVKENKKKVKKEEKKAETTLSLVDVRAQLAAISRGGKQEEVKGLLKDFGADKLTDIDPAAYTELLAKAKEL